MSESKAVKPNRVNPDSDPPDVFEVDIATRPVPIWFEYAALRDLHADVPATEDSLGLLLGSLSPQALRIRHCDVFPVKLPKSSPTALHNPLREFINSRRQSPLQGAERLVGFFRTQAGGWPEMLESDRDIAKRYFRAQGSLFLLIRTPEHRPWSAALFELDGDGAASKAPTVEFPFDEYLLRNGYLTGLLEAPEPMGLLAQPEAAQPNKTNWIIAGVASAILIGGMVAALEYGWFRPTGSKPEAATRNVPAAALLKLKVNRNGRDFEVSWDRTADTVQLATGGTLTINDGALTRVVSLSGPQLREGQILYTPLFEELNFRLEIGSRDQPAAAESVQVLAWSGKQTADVVTVAPADPLTNSPARIIASSGIGTGAGKQPPFAPDPRLAKTQPAAPKAESPQKNAVVTPAAPAVNSAPAANSGKQTEPAKPPGAQETARVIQPTPDAAKSQPAVAAPPPVRNPETSPAAVERPPVTQPIPQSTQPPANTTPAQPPVAPAPKPEPPPSNQSTSPAVSTQAVPPPVAPPAVASNGTAAPATFSGAVVLPVAIQRVAPSLPRGISTGNSAGGPRMVTVRVMVNAAGSVQSAEVVSLTPKGTFGESLIKSAAVDAARLWKFRPGQVNGKNVAAEYSIDFQFR